MPATSAPESNETQRLPEDLKGVLDEAGSAHQEATSMIHTNMGVAVRLAETALGEDAKPELEAMQELSGRALEAANTFKTRAERYSSPYVISPELQKVLRVAMLLKKPLLLEGEPGTGKTSLAYALAAENDLSVIHCRGKSTLTAQSVMYEIDYVSRLNDATLIQAIPEGMKAEASVWRDRLQAGYNPDSADFQSFMKGLENSAKLLNLGRVSDIRNYIRFGELGEAICRAARGEKVILLIDEIDKAKREFPNDLLDEIEHLTLRIQETGEEISAPRGSVVVLVTSNHEKELPEPFLRRCVYNYIRFPDPDLMSEIVRVHVPDVNKPLLQAAIEKFYEVRRMDGIQKKPSTSELIEWFIILQEFGVTGFDGSFPFPEVLLKHKEDIDKLEALRATESELLRRNGMPELVIDALQGKNVVSITPEAEYSPDKPDPYVYTVLANAGFQFTTYAKEYQKRPQPFDVHVEGVKRVDDGVFSFSCEIPEAKRLYELLTEEELFKSMYMVTNQSVRLTTIVTSNKYYLKGYTEDNRSIVYRTPDGRFVYESPFPYEEPKKSNLPILNDEEEK